VDVLIPVSAGHLIDQIAILRVKKMHIADPHKLESVCRELDALKVRSFGNAAIEQERAIMPDARAHRARRS